MNPVFRPRPLLLALGALLLLAFWLSLALGPVSLPLGDTLLAALRLLGAALQASPALLPPGPADLAVLDRDIFEIEPAHIKDVRVDMTMINGEVVYTR